MIKAKCELEGRVSRRRGSERATTMLDSPHGLEQQGREGKEEG